MSVDNEILAFIKQLNRFYPELYRYLYFVKGMQIGTQTGRTIKYEQGGVEHEVPLEEYTTSINADDLKLFIKFIYQTGQMRKPVLLDDFNNYIDEQRKFIIEHHKLLRSWAEAFPFFEYVLEALHTIEKHKTIASLKLTEEQEPSTSSTYHAKKLAIFFFYINRHIQDKELNLAVYEHLISINLNSELDFFKRYFRSKDKYKECMLILMDKGFVKTEQHLGAMRFVIRYEILENIIDFSIQDITEQRKRILERAIFHYIYKTYLTKARKIRDKINNKIHKPSMEECMMQFNYFFDADIKYHSLKNKNELFEDVLSRLTT